MYLRYFHIRVQLFPNVNSVVNHICFTENIEFCLQQLIFVVNLQHTTCDITKISYRVAMSNFHIVPVSPIRIPAEEIPSGDPDIDLYETLNQISPSCFRHVTLRTTRHEETLYRMTNGKFETA